MKNQCLFIVLFLYLGTLASVNAQTTLSFTSRGDIASVIGFSVRGNPFVSDDTKKIGARASFGFEAAHVVSQNQSVIAGIEYAISGFDYRKDLIFGSDIDPITGQPISSSYSKGAYRYDFIALPLGYRWTKPNEKWKFYGQVSLIPMAYLRTIKSNRFSESGTIYDRITESERNFDFQDFHLVGSAAIGMERTIFKSWVIGLQPTFRVHVNSITSTEFKERPWTAGLQLNIGRQLAGQ